MSMLYMERLCRRNAYSMPEYTVVYFPISWKAEVILAVIIVIRLAIYG